MAEAAQNRVQVAMKEFIDNIDKSKLRPVQKRMYLCNAECMDDTMGTMEEGGSLSPKNSKKENTCSVHIFNI